MKPTDAESCALEAMRQIGRPAAVNEIASRAGYTRRAIQRAVKKLHKRRLVRWSKVRGHRAPLWRLRSPG